MQTHWPLLLELDMRQRGAVVTLGAGDVAEAGLEVGVDEAALGVREGAVEVGGAVGAAHGDRVASGGGNMVLACAGASEHGRWWGWLCDGHGVDVEHRLLHGVCELVVDVMPRHKHALMNYAVQLVLKDFVVDSHRQPVMTRRRFVRQDRHRLVEI